MAFKLNVFTGTFDIVNRPDGIGVTRSGPTGDRNIAIWAGNSVDAIQDSKALIQPSGVIEAQGFITNRNLTESVNVKSGYTWIAPSLNVSPGVTISLEPDAQLIII
jgi:hypothetical protein